MSKKKEIKKDLQKRLCAIVEIYMEQKGKANRKRLSDFIEKKMAEIISFRDNLDVEKKTGKKEKILNSEVIKAAKTPVLQPSPALADELHNHA